METPLGKTTRELDQEDAFTASLTNIAYTPAEPQSKRKSRFWFTISTVEQDVAKSKSTMVPSAKEHIDAEVEGRLKDYRVEIQPVLKANIATIREFFLNDIAPLVLASSAGTIQSREVVQRLLEGPVDGAMFSRFDNMVNRAATLKLASFVQNYFGLAQDQIPALLGPQPAQQDNGMKQVLEALKNMVTKEDLASSIRSVNKVRSGEEKFVETQG